MGSLAPLEADIPSSLWTTGNDCCDVCGSDVGDSFIEFL